MQYFEIFLNSAKSAHSTKLSTIFLKALNIYLLTKIFQNVKIVMLQWNILQYLTKNIVTIFQLQWKIGNISDMFLEYSVLCGTYSKCSVAGGLEISTWRCSRGVESGGVEFWPYRTREGTRYFRSDRRGLTLAYYYFY